MVNLELGRDYYADLELPQNATANDVRKQFRKLALKYHPDRNPGQEVEFNSKFQAISAANEILTDPGLRAKYDAQRLKEGPSKSFTDPVGRPNVPPRTRPTHFAPPPRPPPHSAYKATFTPPPTAAGARRHEKAPRPTSSTWGPVDPEEVRSKTSDFKAWEQMRHGQGPLPKHRPPPPPRASKPATAFEPDHGSPPRKPPDGLSSRARKRWEDLLDAGRQAYGGRPPKKAGHGHESPDEDELPSRPPPHSGRKPGDMPPPPPRPGKIPDPGHLKDQHPAVGQRVRASQPTSGSERMKPASPGLQRATTSATPRDHKAHPAWSNVDSVHLNGEHIRATSAGAAHRDESFRSAGISSSTTSATTSSGSSDEDGLPNVFGKTQSARERRIPKSRKARMPAGAGIRLKSGFSPHVKIREDEGQAPHPGYSDLRRHSGIDLPTQSTFGDYSEGLNPPQMGFGMSPHGSHRPSLSASQASGERIPQRHRSFDGRYQSPPPFDTSRPPPAEDGKESTNGSSSFRQAASSTRSGAPPPPLRSQSSETISSRLHTTAASPPRFSTDNPFAAHWSPRHDSDSTAVPSEAPLSTEGDNPASATDIPPPPKVGDKWSSEDWEKRFGPHTFEVPQSNISNRPSVNKRAGTPRMGSFTNVKRAGTFRGNSFQPTVVDDDDSGASDRSSARDSPFAASKSRPSEISNGSAMDIDSSPPASEKVTFAESEISPTTKARYPPLVPSPLGHTNVKPPPVPESGDTKLNFSDFRHVAPFASSQDGLNGVDDLKGALPFQSRPSPTQPDFTKCFEKMELPNPPKPPSPPGELSDAAFAQYVSAMNHYMFHWNSFSTKILMLFQRRQEEHREIGQGWVGLVGGDVDAYLHALDEDERGRQWWDTASDRHKKAMLNLKSIRERMLKSKGVI